MTGMVRYVSFRVYNDVVSDTEPLLADLGLDAVPDGYSLGTLWYGANPEEDDLDESSDFEDYFAGYVLVPAENLGDAYNLDRKFRNGGHFL